MVVHEPSGAIRTLISKKIVGLLGDGESLAGIARKLDVTYPAISHARDGRSCGLDLMLRFADVYWGGSFDAMMREALGGGATTLHPSVSDAQIEYLPPCYPERDKAVAGARVMGYCEQAIAWVLGYTYPDGVDASCITRDEWFDMIRDADKNIADKRRKYGGGAEFDVTAPLRRVSEKHAVGE